MQALFQKITAFFAAIAAFFAGLFGVNKPTLPPKISEPEIVAETKTVLSDPNGDFNYFAWPSVTRLRDGRLAVTCSGFRKAHLCPFGQAVMMTSGDEGETYSEATAVIDTPLDDRDAGVVAFGENGVIVTSFNNSRAAQRRWNPDNAEYMAYVDTITDEDEARYLGATYRLSFDGGRTFGEILISPVTSPHGPTALADGTLLWVGRTFSAENVFDENNRLEAWRIEADGRMTFVGAVPTLYRNGVRLNVCEPHTIQLPDGSLLCQFRENKFFTVYQTRSSDGGVTWSQPEQILSDQGGSPPQLCLLSSGVLISVYGYRAGPKYGVRVMISEDLGQTWRKDYVLWETGVSQDLGYPATVELKDGTLLTVFYAKDSADGPAVIKQLRWRLT